MDIDPEELTGTRFDEDYYLIEVIGQGGMGVVFRAEEQRSGREVAVKLLLPKEKVTQDTYSRFLERFRREAAVMQLDHPNILPVYKTGIADLSAIIPGMRLAYLVMPYIEGRTLAQKLVDGQLPLRDALRYIEQVARALTVAHAEGITHRDLKPGNFLLDEQERLYVADFGIAHLEGSTLTQAGEFLGTRGYAAPEVQRGGEVDPRADIYSLGIILFELLVGDIPFNIGRNQGTPYPEIDAVYRKATAENPQARYSSALEFANAVRKARNEIHRQPTEFAEEQESGIGNRTTWASIKTRLPSSLLSLRNLMIGVIILLIIGSSLFAMQLFAAAHPSTPILVTTVGVTKQSVEQTPQAVLQAEQTVEQYYSYWNKQDYASAYALLDETYQQQHSLDSLLPDYQHTHMSCVKIDMITEGENGAVKVSLTVSAIEDYEGHPGETIVNVYQGYFLVQQRPTGAKLSPSFKIVSIGGGNCQG